MAESELDEIVDHWPERCAGCGGDLAGGKAEAVGKPHRRQVAELPPIAVRMIEHRAHALHCECGHRTRAQLPEQVRASAFGPRLQAAIALLSVRNRISRRDASELCGELFGSEISVGPVDAVCQRASGTLAEPYARCARRSRTPRSSAYETGWRNAGCKRTLWGALTRTSPPFTLPPPATSASCPS